MKSVTKFYSLQMGILRTIASLSSVLILFIAMPALAQDEPNQTASQTKQEESNSFGLHDYLKDMGHILSTSWCGGRPDVSRSAIVEFTLHANGAVSDVKISKSSGVKSIDDSAVATVKKTTLPVALPAGAPEELDVNFTFRLNVYS